MIVIFDVDGTLLKGDSLLIAAKFSRSKLGFFVSSIKFIPLFFLWKIRIISTKKIKEKFIRIFKICEKFNYEEKNGRPKWLLNYLKKNINKEAYKKLIFHKEKGDQVILCSASLDMLLIPLAEYLDVDLISTKLEKFQDLWTSKIKGEICNGLEKIESLKRELKEKIDINEIEAYGDSRGDKELLEFADYPHFRSFSNESSEYPKYQFENILLIVSLIFFGYGILVILNQGYEVITTITKNHITIFKCLILILIGYFLRFLRWRILGEKLNLKIPIKDDFFIWMGSFAFTATPAKTGEAIRAYFLNKKFKLPLPKTLSTILFERLSDAFSVVLILMLNLNFLLNSIDYKISFSGVSSYYPLFFLIVMTIFFLKIIPNKINIKNSFRKYLPKIFIESTAEGYITLKKLFTLRIIFLTSILGVLSWLLEGSSLYYLINALGYSQININGAILTHTASGLIGALSMLPGGLGSTEISMISILSMQGLSLKIASLSTLIIRLMTLWFATLLGIISLFVLKKKS